MQVQIHHIIHCEKQNHLMHVAHEDAQGFKMDLLMPRGTSASPSPWRCRVHAALDFPLQPVERIGAGRAQLVLPQVSRLPANAPPPWLTGTEQANPCRGRRTAHPKARPPQGVR